MRALFSVSDKTGLVEFAKGLVESGWEIIATGGTQKLLEDSGVKTTGISDVTGFPEICGGRVKTLHPRVHGGLLGRRDNPGDMAQLKENGIETIDMVCVNLYPFEATVASGASFDDIIEKIDIGGISLIRGAAKNFNDVVIVASERQFGLLESILDTQGAETTLEQRQLFAREAFAVSSGYDSAIYNWFAGVTPVEPGKESALRVAIDGAKALRYGENPHQAAAYYGNFDAIFDQLHGKEISYNNLLDIDAACALIDEFDTTTMAVLKHNNACGCASRGTVAEAWADALAGDPVSAFGGIIITNSKVEADAAAEMGKIFFEVIIAPDYSDDALTILQQKKNRIILRRKAVVAPGKRMRTILGGMLVQDNDSKLESPEELKLVAGDSLSDQQVADMLFANKLVKHSKSNAIVLARNGQLIASGVGQTSRVDALKQAIEKAHSFGFDLHGATMASDAFFPFGDCVEIAHKAGVDNVIQPGGSIRDNDSIKYCDENGVAMVMTGFRHFRH